MKSKYLMIGAAVCAALFLFSGVMLYRQYADEKQSAEAFDNIAALVQDETPPADEPQESESPQPEQTAFEKYAAVYEQNSDFVGWISIERTNIDYPVMQTVDNPNYYLKRSFEKQYSDYGVPYVQENCDLGLSDNCVIYGHHMNNGSMFADLCKYESEDFYQSHKIIRFDTTKANISYDVLEMSGSRAVWPEVLAIYAVKTTTDPDNAQEVATMDDSKKAILKDIFWQMNEISSRTETKTEEVITETDDGHGNIVETKTTVTRTYLYITVSHKTADEMADQYNFSADQRKQLAELLADVNRSMWSAVLYGIGTGDGEIVTVALSQIGNVGGEPYWSWYGFNSRVEWCACFVSWCANECGYIDAGVIPKFAGCVWGVEWFRDRGLWQDNSYEPRPGDIIFFDWDDENGQDGESDHVGIVEKVENGTVYTVEGNSGDSCRENHYAVGHYEILGYGVPQY